MELPGISKHKSFDSEIFQNIWYTHMQGVKYLKINDEDREPKFKTKEERDFDIIIPFNI